MHVHRTEGVTGCVGREETNGFRGGIKVGDRNGDRNGVRGGNGDVNVDEEGDRVGTRSEVRANQGTQDGNENGKRDRAGEFGGDTNMRKKPRRVVDIMWETGETWAEGIENKTRKYYLSICQLRQYKD